MPRAAKVDFIDDAAVFIAEQERVTPAFIELIDAFALLACLVMDEKSAPARTIIFLTTGISTPPLFRRRHG